MFNTFNMGVGMSIVVPENEVDTAIEILTANGENPYVIGEIIENTDSKIILEQYEKHCSIGLRRRHEFAGNY